MNFMLKDIPRTSFRNLFIIFIAAFILGSINPIVDLIRHPEIPFFDIEHIIVATTSFIIIFISLFIIWIKVQQLKQKATLEIKDKEKVIESERQLADIINFLPYATFVIDTKGYVKIWNRAVEELTGVRSESIIGKDNYEYSFVLHNARVPILIDLVQNPTIEIPEFYKNVNWIGSTINAETYFTSKNITGKKYVLVSATKLYNSDGEVVGAIETIKDLTERKNAEDELRKSENNYKDLIENMNDLICTHDLNGNILSANKSALKMLGYSMEELLKSNLKDFIVPEQKDNFDLYLNIIKDRGHTHGFLTVLTKNNERRIWEYDNSLRSDGVQYPIVRGIAKDVTEQKLASDALKKSELKYRSFFENVQDVFYQTDLKGTILEISPSIENNTGYKREEVIGKSIEMFYENYSDREALIKLIMKKTKIEHYELKVKTKDNKILFVKCY